LRGEERNLQNDIERAATTIENIKKTIERREKEMQQASNDIVVLTTEIAENEVVLAEFLKELEELEGKRDAVSAEHVAKRQEIQHIESKIRDERRLHDDSLNVTHELEMKIAELRTKAEAIKQRSKDEFDFDLLLKEYGDDDQFSISGAREEVRILKGKIRSLGPVNLLAFTEYQAEKERLNFLTTQRADLFEAEKTLNETIEQINATAQKKFLDTFALIRQNFVSLFKHLFEEGDEADLLLDEGDPLEAGIEIIAKPRGKRPHSIEMLSGGEKTLTAIALLFAIYLVKPSPFCILDEVDAPLDDANIDRFVKILRKFSDNTQFIVVTHNKRTMEAADVLYGVTMEEEGVSKLVSVRFTDELAMKN
jgi:chromosome segregation protein